MKKIKNRLEAVCKRVRNAYAVRAGGICGKKYFTVSKEERKF